MAKKTKTTAKRATAASKRATAKAARKRSTAARRKRAEEKLAALHEKLAREAIEAQRARTARAAERIERERAAPVAAVVPHAGPIKVKVLSASVDAKGRRHIKARVVGYNVVLVGVKTPGIRAWAFDRQYAWTPATLVALNVALDVAWRGAMQQAA